MTLLKRAASHLSPRFQQELKRLHFSRQIRKGAFQTDEAEYSKLGQWVRPGDWVLDVGANVGHYSNRLSELVGPTGRVFAFEPVPQTFEILAANMGRCPLGNITLLNVAASDTMGVVGMSIPRFDTGLENYYRSSVTTESSALSVMAAPSAGQKAALWMGPPSTPPPPGPATGSRAWPRSDVPLSGLGRNV